MREFNSKDLDSVGFDELVRDLRNGVDGIVLINIASLPEADVLCCEYEGRKFNVKFDLDYGVSIEAIDIFSEDEFMDVVRRLKK